MSSAPVPKTAALHCPNCGGPVEFRGFGHALTVVCPQCLSVLDASSPLLKIVQEAQDAQSRRTPLIPLGNRGKWAGVTWECIGFQTRGVEEDGVVYEWEEYLLFNPYHGFRYLTNYEGHWNFVTPVESLPQRRSTGLRPAVFFEDNLYRHFSGAQATTSFVLGEFPWRVKVGEEVLADDFVHPPFVLSSETTSDEVTWSQGEYISGAELWKAFACPGSAPRPQGIYLNQPSPYKGSVSGHWSLFVVMLTFLFLIALGFAAFSTTDTVFDDHYHYSTADRGEPSFVTKVFNIEGHTGNLALTIHTNLVNNWAYFDLALINDKTGDAFAFGREVSYYTDSDGSEGSPTSTAVIPHVPAGSYYLRVEPEMDGSQARSASPTALQAPSIYTKSMYYEIELRRGVVTYGWFWLAALLLLIWPIIHTIRAAGFETRRWAASDYPPVPGGG